MDKWTFEELQTLHQEVQALNQKFDYLAGVLIEKKIIAVEKPKEEKK